MLPKVKGPSQHFNAYYHNDSILIQFVVSEFVSTHQLAAQIKNLAQASLHSTQALEQAVHPLFSQLSQLLGTVHENDRLSVSRWSKGPLTKLKHYCEQFAKSSRTSYKQNLVLYTTVHQAWLSGIQNLDLLNVLQQSSESKVSVSALMAIKRALHHLDQRLNAIIKHIPRILSAYKDNENVLFFILKQRDSLAGIYGSDFITKIFKCFSKKNELSQLIIQRYIKRGFDHLLPLIHQSSPVEAFYL